MYKNVILMRCSYCYKRLLTTTLFYFHLSFFFQKTIPLQEVTDVRKAKTAAIFHNAIEIIAGTKRHFFGSFLSRDEAFRIIVEGWEQHVSDARLLLERQVMKHL
jgi:hypothetical protein